MGLLGILLALDCLSGWLIADGACFCWLQRLHLSLPPFLGSRSRPLDANRMAARAVPRAFFRCSCSGALFGNSWTR